MSTGRKLQAFRWNAAEARPRLVKLARVGTRLEKLAPEEAAELTGYGYYYSQESSKIHYTAALQSLELANDLYGVEQFYLSE